MSDIFNKLPERCPSCNNSLHVTRLKCGNCGTEIEGNFTLAAFLKLSEEEQQFIWSFVKHSGSLKKMAKEMEKSYPSVRNYLDEIIAHIEKLEVHVKNQ